MCECKSGLWTRKGLVSSLNTESHEDLIKEKGFKDDGIKPEFVRVEYAPKNFMEFLKQREKYKDFVFKIDQDILPEWFDKKQEEKKIIAEIKKAVLLKLEKRYINFDVEEIKDGKDYIIYGSAVVQNVRDSAVVRYVYGSAVVQNVCDSAVVQNVCDSAVVRYVRNSAVVQDVWSSAVVQIVCDSAVVRYVRNSAVVRYVWSSAVVQNVYDSAVVQTVCDSAVVQNVYDSAVVQNVWDSAVVQNVWDSAVVQNVWDRAVAKITNKGMIMVADNSNFVLKKSSEVNK